MVDKNENMPPFNEPVEMVTLKNWPMDREHFIGHLVMTGVISAEAAYIELGKDHGPLAA